MDKTRPIARVPEFIVFARSLVVGFISAEVLRVAVILGNDLAAEMNDLNLHARAIAVLIASLIVLAYVLSRGAISSLRHYGHSWRVDLLMTFCLGAVANKATAHHFQTFHELVAKAGSTWAALIVSLTLIMMISAVARGIRTALTGPKKIASQLYFLQDDEIEDKASDVLGIKSHAEQFAKTVLESNAEGSLVYGIDAPWGTGKSSFINLACKYWLEASRDQVIVFRFEPLRYASDPDLAERFIRDLTSEIQQQLFVPELRPAASRYSRMLKGKADFSFLGFKFSLEPSNETIDDLLEDVDDVLKRMDRRLIVIVDDLDRLEPKLVNNVLFTVRRTFKLELASYVLCYDTENLLAGAEDGERARQFLEKFINIKQSLFVDSSVLVRFLREDWGRTESKYPSIPSGTMLKLAALLSELAEALNGPQATKYMAIVGDMRKIKRFVNAVRMIRLEETDFARTDFHLRDMVNLVLLHLNYPTIFRRIYVEETDGRNGIFSMKFQYKNDQSSLVNDAEFDDFLEKCPEGARFLVRELFFRSADALSDLENSFEDESVRATRACFNTPPYRNLERYLMLIVRFITPSPRATFKLYQEAVQKVISGTPVENVLLGKDFSLDQGESAHDQFWRILVSEAHDFDQRTADDAIETLVQTLPQYSIIEITKDTGLRENQIYNLVRLLDRAGWGRTEGKRRNNTRENIIEIAHRIFGDFKYKGHALIDRLGDVDRGIMGLNDLLLFRLQCSADRMGQLYNLQSALILREDTNAPTTGMVTALALAGMRGISQRIFGLFKSRYIDTRRNIFKDMENTGDKELTGRLVRYLESLNNPVGVKLAVSRARSNVAQFCIYQLCNTSPPSNSGVGLGYYDAEGSGDAKGIAEKMNTYIFEVCFNPDIAEENATYFLNHFLCRFSKRDDIGGTLEKYSPSVYSLTAGLDRVKLALFWENHSAKIRSKNYQSLERNVVASDYMTTYSTGLPALFDTLDKLQQEISARALPHG